jgi:hypothetical protein
MRWSIDFGVTLVSERPPYPDMAKQLKPNPTKLHASLSPTRRCRPLRTDARSVSYVCHRRNPPTQTGRRKAELPASALLRLLTAVPPFLWGGEDWMRVSDMEGVFLDGSN